LNVTQRKDNFNSSSNNIVNELYLSKEKFENKILNDIQYKATINNQFNNLLISNNSSIKIEGKEEVNDDINRCSSIKGSIDISATEYSLMKEIKDINTAIENKNKKIENFLDTKNKMKQILEENFQNVDNNNKNNKIISNSSTNGNFENINDKNFIKNNKLLLQKKSSETNDCSNFNLNDPNLNQSKISDLRICKNVNLSLMENSLLSLIKKDSPNLSHNFSNKNLFNNNEFIIFSCINNQNNNCNDNYLINESINNFQISDKSIIKHSFKECESQNFWFGIKNEIEKKDEKKFKENIKIFNPEDFIEEQNSKSLIKNSKEDKNNTSKVNNIIYESLLTEEKVKEFSLISIENNKFVESENKSKKSINNSKISYDSNSFYNKSCRKYSKNNNNYLIPNEKFCNIKNYDKKFINNYKKHQKKINEENSLEYKTNIMKIRKNNRRSINKKLKESNKLIKIKDFEEILVEANNKSFEEKTENCFMFKNFFGIFDVFKCGRGNANQN